MVSFLIQCFEFQKILPLGDEVTNVFSGLMFCGTVGGTVISHEILKVFNITVWNAKVEKGTTQQRNLPSGPVVEAVVATGEVGVTSFTD